MTTPAFSWLRPVVLVPPSIAPPFLPRLAPPPGRYHSRSARTMRAPRGRDARRTRGAIEGNRDASRTGQMHCRKAVLLPWRRRSPRAARGPWRKAGAFQLRAARRFSCPLRLEPGEGFIDEPSYCLWPRWLRLGLRLSPCVQSGDSLHGYLNSLRWGLHPAWGPPHPLFYNF
jgi:hypothetical protein